MEVIRGSESIPSTLRGAVVTIGNFDGVHLGHQVIFRKLVEEAHREGRPAVAISFDPHPKMVLHPERRPFYLITSLEEKTRLLADLGLDAFLVIPFTLAYAKTTAEAFVGDILLAKLQIRKILIGHDYTFGRGKEGNAAFLTESGRCFGFDVEMVGAVQVDDITVSSTRIRDALLTGKVRLAASLLGRPYNLSGRVIHGYRRGAGLGFPTANILPEKALVPPRGVYAAHVLIDGRRHDGVLNIGVNPTFCGPEDRSVEVHILDFKADLYDKTLELLFVDRIRDEVRFENPEALIDQIRQDIVHAREILRGNV